MQNDLQHGCGQPCGPLPLAIATVPMQRFRQLYDPATALGRGTLFRELDLPFYGKRGGGCHE